MAWLMRCADDEDSQYLPSSTTVGTVRASSWDDMEHIATREWTPEVASKGLFDENRGTPIKQEEVIESDASPVQERSIQHDPDLDAPTRDPIHWSTYIVDDAVEHESAAERVHCSDDLAQERKSNIWLGAAPDADTEPPPTAQDPTPTTSDPTSPIKFVERGEPPEHIAAVFMLQAIGPNGEGIESTKFEAGGRGEPYDEMYKLTPHRTSSLEFCSPNNDRGISEEQFTNSRSSPSTRPVLLSKLPRDLVGLTLDEDDDDEVRVIKREQVSEYVTRTKDEPLIKNELDVKAEPRIKAVIGLKVEPDDKDGTDITAAPSVKKEIKPKIEKTEPAMKLENEEANEGTLRAQAEESRGIARLNG